MAVVGYALRDSATAMDTYWYYSVCGGVKVIGEGVKVFVFIESKYFV